MVKSTALGPVFWAVSWIPVAFTFTQTVGQAIWIQGSSMQPALNPDSSLGSRDLILVQKWGLRQPSQLSRGDVVIMRSPSEPEKMLVKRITGTQGETIEPRLLSNYPRSQVKIPPSHVWVEGDNVHSLDSNEFGPVSTGLIVGKARWIVYPLSRWGPVPARGDIELE